MNYECHITVNTADAKKATKIAEEQHWKTSEIARDPVLGDKNFFYLTTHTNSYALMLSRMSRCAEALRSWDVEVIREKIELIIHDTKTNRIACASDVLESESMVAIKTKTQRPTVRFVKQCEQHSGMPFKAFASYSGSYLTESYCPNCEESADNVRPR
jgi:hypothetical protein